MFFRERSTQAEYLDHPGRTEAELITEFRELDRLNRFLMPALPFRFTLPRWLGAERCRRLEILDVGAGTGALGDYLQRWAQQRGWDWRFTNLDSNAVGLKLGNQPRTAIGSALALPFADTSFDLVISSQMTHHLTDAEILTHWQEAWRVAREGVFFCDVHRNAGLYALLWLGTRLVGAGKHLREDSLLSVRRGFRCAEWRELAKRAHLPAPKIWIFYGTRIVLQARKNRHA